MEIWISLFELLGILIFTYVVLNKYAASDVSSEMKGLTYVGWLYGFISIALLPFDIYIV